MDVTDSSPLGQIELSQREDSSSGGSFIELLPWEDVIHAHIFDCLSIEALFHLRLVNPQCLQCVAHYFQTCKKVNLTQVGPRYNQHTFLLMTDDNTSLQTLILRNAKHWLTDQILSPLIERCSRLSILDLTNCNFISNVTLNQVAVSCCSLQEVLLRDCPWVSVQGVCLLAMKCPHLEKVDLSGCWQLSDEAIMALAALCKQLRVLHIAKIYGVTDKSVMSLARNSTKLYHLNLQGCWRVTDDAIRMLAEYCTALKMLQVRECREITMISVARLHNKGIRVDIPLPKYKVNPEFSNYLEKLKLQV